MKKTRKISGLLMALLFAWGSANAAGLGKLSVQSALGQPLRAEIELLSVSKEELADITARLASADAFRQARIDRQEALSGLRFIVDQRANGQPVIRISSTASVQDPFLDMLIELNWSSGRLIREYTILLDPPAGARSADAVRPANIADTSRTPVQNRSDDTPAGADAGKAKAASPTPSENDKPTRYGPVKSGETLRAIAGKVKPADVSLEQMMVGLYQANKNAFQNNNMNRLNRGRVLNVPDADKAMAISRNEAARTVSSHASEWHAYRRKLADMAGESAAPKAANQSEGKISASEPAKDAPAGSAPKDVLKLSKGEPGGPGKVDAKAQERMQAMEEEIAAKGRALQEAQDRVTQLERTVRDMQKLIELKAQDAAKAPPAPAPTESVPAAVEPPPVAETPPPAPAPVEKPKPAPVVVPLPVAEPSSSWISTFISNPIYIGGIVAALLLSALLWMMMVGSKRRQGLTKFEDSIMTGGEFKNNAVFKASAGNIASGSTTEGSMLLTDFSRLGMGAIDSHEVDPIAEAEVYMAYGRDAQAEEILREALVKDPSRYEIALKLLELYASRKDTNSFETTASELYAGLSGQNTPVWQRAAEMGRSIDPQNPLYRVVPTQPEAVAMPAAVAATAATAVSAAAVVQAAPTSKPDVDFAAMDQLSSMDDWGDSVKSDAGELTATANNELDFSQAVEAPATDDNLMEFASELQPSSPLDLSAALVSTEAVPLDELDLPPAAPDAFEMTAPAETEDLSVEFGEAMDLDSLPEAVASAPTEDLSDFDLPDELSSLGADDGIKDEMPILDLSGIDLELETGLEPDALPEAGAAAVEALELATDFDAFADLPESAEVVPAVDSSDVPEIEAVAVAEEAEPAADDADIDPELREEVNTKLDLARAYMEMGDREGAREILQEVLGEGDKQQKAEAEKLMVEAA